MSDSLSFKEFFVNQDFISIDIFLINILLTTMMSFLLATLYIKFGSSLSDRKTLANVLITISLTTMIIITIVKSSLALSLGLVGALSIIRFRTAIKEPEELSYLFIAIAIGLGFGANQRLTTLIGTGITGVIIFLLRLIKSGYSPSNLQLEIRSNFESNELLSKVVDVLSKYCDKVLLTSVDIKDNNFSALFNVSFKEYHLLEAATKDLKGIDNKISISFFKM